MKYESYYKELIGADDSQEVFDYLIKTLKPTISGWDYFVHWNKINKSISDLEVNLNILNVLIGKEDASASAVELFTKYPQVIPAIPILIACRDNEFNILTSYQDGEFKHENFTFTEKSDPIKVVNALEQSGFLEQIRAQRIKSLVDYVFGVEVGLDTNGRKNRSGTSMEKIVEFFVSDLCQKNTGYEYLAQATAPKIAEKWGAKITVEKSSRSIDFAIRRPDGKIFLIETNFYGGGGSKLKSTAGEYQTDFIRWKADGHEFIWITDGQGWISTWRPLKDTFDKIDRILNLKMLEVGLLSNIVRK